MGMQTIEWEWDVNISFPHKVGVKRIGGKYEDILEVSLDDILIASAPAGAHLYEGEVNFQIDGHPVKLKWTWDSRLGDPKSMLLISGDTILVRYDNPESQKLTKQERASSIEFAQTKIWNILATGLLLAVFVPMFFCILPVGPLLALIKNVAIGSGLFCLFILSFSNSGSFSTVSLKRTKNSIFFILGVIAFFGTPFWSAYLSHLIYIQLGQGYWVRLLSMVLGAIISNVSFAIIIWFLCVISKAPFMDPSKDPASLTLGHSYHHPTSWPPLSKSTLIKQRRKARSNSTHLPENNQAETDNLDLVDCTVFAPAISVPGELVFVQVFAHIPNHVQKSYDLAREFDRDAQRRGFKSLEVKVARETQLTFELIIRGLEIDEPAQTLTWNGRPESVQFALLIPEHFERGVVIGTVIISQDLIPVGHIKFKLAIQESQESSYGIPTGDDAKRYALAFISYASADREKVLQRVQILKALSISFFQDILSLSPGERWEEEIYKWIDECDLFLLFWSSSAKESVWVRKEINYALSRKQGDEFAPPEIKPVILDGPPVVPPWPEISHLHFNDPLVYLINK